MDGLLVIRNGYIVAEGYYNGYDRMVPHNIKSVSKSFLSALTGIAIDKGYLNNLEQKILDYFPEYIHPGMDPRKYDIIIGHLLTMRMGIDREEENLWDVIQSENWIETILELPLLFDPGERMRYNSCQTHLLSAILAKSCNMTTFEFAKTYLTDPMGISIDNWVRDPQGYYFGGSEMYFTPREMATLGYMYLNKGWINNRQVVPHDWVDYTLTASTNNAHNEWGAWKNYDYAYLWWLGQFNDYGVFMAYGYGGQFVICFPTLDLIIVSTAETEVDLDTSTIQEWAIFDIVSQYIVPAIIR
jgi:CubicO group peptidase (beta-lactamase class C family)